MKENAPQTILDARGNRRQFLEFVAGAGTGAAAGLFARSQNIYAKGALLPAAIYDTENHKTAEEVVPVIGGVIGGAGGFIGGGVEGMYRYNRWAADKKLTEDEKEDARVNIPLYLSLGGLILGGGLGAGVGYGAVKLLRRIF